MASDLLSFIVDPEEGDTSLHLAALTGDVLKVRQLLCSDSGRNLINARMRPFGATPLRLASSAGNVECMQELLKNGAYVDLVDIKAQTPLFVAVYNNKLESCELLLKSGANPNGDRRNLVAPLHVACQNGSAPAVQLLLQHGCAVEGALTHPLHVAATYGHMNCFILLLLHGAKTSLAEYAVGQPSIVPILAKNKSNPLFLRLWVLFGGSLWYNDSTGKRVFVDVEEGPLIEVLHNLKTFPLSLKCQSRIKIWKLIQYDVLKHINSLGLPKTLVNYLGFRDIPEIDNCFAFLEKCL
ncbi:Transient receptor potential channel pyrexia [Gryllus bimaculatus]|nr:Transient receptor potential channel pyrexia [Gryllus bimaculatus]